MASDYANCADRCVLNAVSIRKATFELYDGKIDIVLLPDSGNPSFDSCAYETRIERLPNHQLYGQPFQRSSHHLISNACSATYSIPPPECPKAGSVIPGPS